MYSELFRIPVEWSGIPIFGVGLLLALWLIGGGIGIAVLSKRGGFSAEMLSYLPGFLIVAAALGGLPRIFPEGLPIRGYGVMVLSGAVAGLWLATYRARQMNFNPELIYALAFGMFLCGVLGARLFYVIEYWESRFQRNSWLEMLLAIAKFTEGGLVVYGALIGATVAFLVFVIRHKLPPFAVADLIAPSLLVGLAFGRIGCLLNGCCYGGETTVPWAVTFPRDSLTYMEQLSSGRLAGLRIASVSEESSRLTLATVEADSPAARAGLAAGMGLVSINGRPVSSLADAQDAIFLASRDRLPLRLETTSGKIFEVPTSEAPARSRPVHPTQIYSTVHAGLLAWVLWSFYPFRRRDGEVTALMLTVYPVSRFLLEMIRIDESAVFGTGLSISQNISILLLASTVGLWVYLLRQPKGLARFGSPSG